MDIEIQTQGGSPHSTTDGYHNGILVNATACLKKLLTCVSAIPWSLQMRKDMCLWRILMRWRSPHHWGLHSLRLDEAAMQVWPILMWQGLMLTW